jgi:dihydroxyacetone kinase-like protein
MQVGIEALRAIIKRLGHDVECHREHLNALDAAVGDGDLGVSACNGFRAVCSRLDVPASDVGELLLRAGEDIEDNAGATIGALLGTALLKAGHAMAGKSELTLPDIAAALQAAETAIRVRGKADVGDKTILDVLVPVRKSLVDAIADNAALDEIVWRVRGAAERGVAYTVPLRAKFGRGRWIGARTEGHPDPGASLLHMMVESVLRT